MWAARAICHRLWPGILQRRRGSGGISELLHKPDFGKYVERNSVICRLGNGLEEKKNRLFLIDLTFDAPFPPPPPPKRALRTKVDKSRAYQVSFRSPVSTSTGTVATSMPCDWSMALETEMVNIRSSASCEHHTAKPSKWYTLKTEWNVINDHSKLLYNKNMFDLYYRCELASSVAAVRVV